MFGDEFLTRWSSNIHSSEAHDTSDYNTWEPAQISKLLLKVQDFMKIRYTKFCLTQFLLIF